MKGTDYLNAKIIAFGDPFNKIDCNLAVLSFQLDLFDSLHGRKFTKT